MSDNFVKEIISGGQTDVDRAALDIAIELNIAHGGWCPYGRKAEDGIILPQYRLQEAPPPTFEERLDPDAIYKKRTELNAQHSDGTLIITKDQPIGGTLYTIQMVKKHQKPYCVINLSEELHIPDVAAWITENNIRKLNVADPRASQDPEIYSAAYMTLQKLFKHSLLNHHNLTSVCRQLTTAPSSRGLSAGSS